MSGVIITLAAPQSPVAHESLVQWIGEVVKVREVRLRSDCVIDIVVDGNMTNRDTIEHHAGARMDALKIDRIYQPAEFRKKRLFITDMDSTIIQCECIDEMAEELGLKGAVSRITRTAMEGGLDFSIALQERVGMLRGMTVTQLESVYANRVRWSPGVEALMDVLKKNGTTTVLVSGGFTFFAERIARRLGFDFYYANELEIVDGALTGKVLDPIVTKSVKLRLLHYHANELRISREEIIAIGDGANDLPMLEAAGLGIAYRAKPIVERKIATRIRFTDLETVAYALG